MSHSTAASSERLTEIVSELGGKPSYAYGDRRPSQPVSSEEAARVAEALSQEVDEGVAERTRIAARQSLKLYCHSGCNTCCNVPVMVYRPEALRVAALLRQPEHAEALAHFKADYPRWRAGLGDLLPRLRTLSVPHREQGPWFDLLVEGTRRRVMCAFNREGRCVVYEARPIGCRNANALDTDASCANDHPDGKKATSLEFAPLDQLVVSASRLLRAVHNAMETTVRHESEALCQSVARLLGIEPTE